MPRTEGEVLTRSGRGEFSTGKRRDPGRLARPGRDGRRRPPAEPRRAARRACRAGWAGPARPFGTGGRTRASRVPALTGRGRPGIISLTDRAVIADKRTGGPADERGAQARAAGGRGVAGPQARGDP